MIPVAIAVPLPVGYLKGGRLHLRVDHGGPVPEIQFQQQEEKHFPRKQVEDDFENCTSVPPRNSRACDAHLTNTRTLQQGSGASCGQRRCESAFSSPSPSRAALAPSPPLPTAILSGYIYFYPSRALSR